MTECLFFNTSRRIRERQQRRFPMNLSEMCRTPTTSGSAEGVRFHTSPLLLFLSAATEPLFVSASFFFLPLSTSSFSNSSLCFGRACASLGLSFTHGSGFGSVTTWFQLQKVRISDRISASTSTSPLSRLTKGKRAQRHTIRAKNKHKSRFRLKTE